MNIQELKFKIENKTLNDDGLIFYYQKNRFLIDQYIYEISKLKNRPIIWNDSLNNDFSMFGDIDDGNLIVISTNDEINIVPNNTIIITQTKCDNCIEFPELEKWQIKDYVYSVCCGVENDILDKLLIANSDIYCLQNEIDKICIFDEPVRKTVSQQFIDENVFHNISSVGYFDFSNAVQNKNKKSIGEMYNEIEHEPMGFVGLMYKQFRNMINVYLQNNPNEQNTGLKDKQIWAIKNVCKKYTKQQVLNIFKFLSEIDYKLKSGELTTDIMFDYVLIKLFLL